MTHQDSFTTKKEKDAYRKPGQDVCSCSHTHSDYSTEADRTIKVINTYSIHMCTQCKLLLNTLVIYISTALCKILEPPFSLYFDKKMEIVAKIY